MSARSRWRVCIDVRPHPGGFVAASSSHTVTADWPADSVTAAERAAIEAIARDAKTRIVALILQRGPVRA